MLRKIIICSLLSLVSLTTLGQVGDGQKIAITPAVCDDLPIPENAKKALNQKLIQMATQNGFGSTSGAFVLTANVNKMNEVVSGSIPPQFIVDYEVSCFIVNLTENIIAGETSFKVRGMDASENGAVVKAINRINVKTPVVREFMAKSREKIIEYYSTRVPTLVAKAQSLADRDQYEEAIAVLAAVPESLDDYPMVAEKMTALYGQMLDKYATMALQDAKSKVALRDYPAALDALMAVDPSSSKYGEATKMVESIKQTIDANERAKVEAKLAELKAQQELAQKMHDDEVMLKKMQIEASKQHVEKQMQTENAGEELQNRLSKWLFGDL